MLRAGWLLGPVLAAPGRMFFGAGRTAKRFWKYYTTDGENFFWCTLGIAVLCTIAWFINYKIHIHSVATPAQIEAALKGNWCMTELMPRRAAVDFKDRAMEVHDLIKGQDDCEEAAAKHQAIEAQRAAMQALQPKK